MSQNKKYTIVVPVYNEQESLTRLKGELERFRDESAVAFDVLFVDDGSSDNSLSMIKSFVAQTPGFYNYLSFASNQGLSAALKAGIDHVQNPYVGYLDADLQTTPFDFTNFYEHMESCTMVNGIRQKRSDSFIKKISSKIANSFRRMMINDGIEDTCCPLKLMETKAVQQLPFFKGMHRFIPALVQLQGGTVKQVPVRHFARIEGQAKYHLFNRMVGPFFDTLAFVWMRKRNIRYKINESSYPS